MEQAIVNIMQEIYSPDIWDTIGICEGFDIYTKDKDGKKAIDLDKVKTELDNIKNAKNSDYKTTANKVKRILFIVLEVLSAIDISIRAVGIGGIVGMSIVSGTTMLLPVLAIPIIVSIIDSAIIIILDMNIPPKDKYDDLKNYREKINTAIVKLEKQKSKVDGKEAAELQKNIDKLKGTVAEINKAMTTANK